ncbi:MAG TPA: ABC transporter permease [Azospira sp.]|nr:ABC transporter permease [Azospira sp.]
MGNSRIVTSGSGGAAHTALQGDWNLVTLAGQAESIAALEGRLRTIAAAGGSWDLNGLGRLDSLGALTLWRAWGRRWPERVDISPEHRHVIERVAAVHDVPLPAPRRDMLPVTMALGRFMLRFGHNLVGMVALLGQLILDIAYVARHPRDLPLTEFSATLYKSGALALPVTALVGVLIGVVMSYLSALQLKTFGADVFIVNILGVSIIRELGPVLVAVLVAGRSGSAMTAQIGVMRVTEEIDALATMGISRTLRLVLPKMAALTLAVPLLVVWTSAAGILGGMISANLQLGLAYSFFLEQLPKAVPVANLWIGLFKGWLFGFLVALVACYFGLHVKPNTESLSARTTSSVVTAITVVILADALIAIATREIGMPG